MEEKLISFETARKAKEKGFDVRCHAYYEVDKEPWLYYSINSPVDYNHVYKKIDGARKLYSAPTQSLLQKWLREVHQVHVFIGWRPNKKVWDSHAYKLTLGGPEYVRYMNLSKFAKMPTYKTYEEALEDGLQEALKILSPETS